ncbi:MAG: GtrA family protein [Oscillospiraceae bacterium]|nr:GtrA family protein [Oscillospiraceae bacterium]MBR4655435.1 GtrA family protein [Oscillospiraceae bacterium]
MKKLSKILDKTFWLYVGLGILNYGICNAIMLVLHWVFEVSTDASLIIEFALQTAVSFVLNRYVTFRGLRISRYWPIKFVVSVGVSYLLAKVLLYKVFEYLITLPFLISIADWVQSIVAPQAEPLDFRHSLVMLACTFIYCAVNYIGQRYYVFKPCKEETEK